MNGEPADKGKPGGTLKYRNDIRNKDMVEDNSASSVVKFR
jgi:hypothetical protein